MAIASNTHFWNARLGGNNPSSPRGDNNDAWTLKTGSPSDGSVSGNAWRISGSGQVWKQTVANDDNDLTIMAGISYNSIPSDNEVLLALDNGSHRVEVRSDGGQKLKLVGTATVVSDGLDISMTDFDAIPLLIRLTLDSSGNGRLYMREIVEDDNAEAHYLQVTGSSSTSQEVIFGNTSGTVDWYSVYYTKHGAYSPDEMDMSDFVTNSLVRTGLSIVNILKSSNRFFLKTHVTENGIVYGYDLSSDNMINRIQPPALHIVIRETDSPEFLTLSGTRTDQRYVVQIYITTRGTDYKNAYRQGASIAGEVFDELYVLTGRQDGVDSLINYEMQFDSRLDSDETICVHVLSLTYMKKIRMHQREV